MLGGSGDDVFWVDNADDSLFETDGEGYDVALVWTSYA